MITKRSLILVLLTTLTVLFLVSGCGTWGYGRRDGNGPRRDGTGGGPCTSSYIQADQHVDAWIA